MRQIDKNMAYWRFWRLFFAAVIVVAVLIGWLILNRSVNYSHQKELWNKLERLDLAGMEPQVVSKLQELREGVKKHPESADAWGKLAMNLDAADLKKESLPIYMEASQLNPSDFRWPYFCAITLSDMGSEEAIPWFERALKVKPDYVPLLIRYGNTLFEYGKMNPASEKYQQAVRYDPAASRAFYGLAQVAFARGDFQSARASAEKAFELDASYGEAANLRATVCRRLNDAQCAQEAAAAAKRLAVKSQLSDPVYQQVGAEGVSSLWYRARGNEYMKQKSYDAAILQFEEAIRIRPDVQTREDLAQALSAAGKLPEAAGEYQQVLKQHPTAQNYFGLGLAMAKMGSYAEAQEFFRKAIELKPDFAEAYFNLAVAFAKTNRLPETIENLQQAVRVNPDYTEAHYDLGLAYLQARDRESALQQSKILMQLNPKAGEQLQHLIESAGN